MPSDGDDQTRAPADGATDGGVPVDRAASTEEADVVNPLGAAPEPQTIAEQVAAATEARRLLWPWVARRTRPQIVALVLISCLALGPAFALVTILKADPTPVSTLIAAPPAGPDVTRITITATRLSPTAGEMQARISIAAADDVVDETGKLEQPVSVAVNGTQGTSIRVFETGEIPSVFEVSLPLTEGTINRYPFDRYNGSSLIVVTVDPGGDREVSPSAIEARSIVSDFSLSAETPEDLAAVVNWTANRPATTTVYAVWLMVLMWGLAVIGLLIVWGVIIWMIDMPFWAVGYLVGVLFALPQLRDSLPGRPPPGTIVDFVSFYWSITIVGVSLILLLAVWLRRVRSESRLRSFETKQEA